MSNLISNIDKEREFVLSYNIKIKELQKVLDDSDVLYTILTPSYCIINELCYINIALHPVSQITHKSYEKPNITPFKIKKTILDIILFELMASITKTTLNKEELDKLIKHFRSVEKQ